MGGIFSLWRRKRKVTDELEQLTTQIQRLSKEKAETEERRSRFIFNFSLLLAVAFLLVAVYIHLWKGPKVTYSPLFLLSGAGSTLVTIYIGRYLANCYYEKRLQWKDARIEELSRKKREILDNVKETETYKVANEILEKFDVSRKQPTTPLASPTRETLRLRHPARTTTRIPPGPGGPNPLAQDRSPLPAGRPPPNGGVLSGTVNGAPPQGPLVHATPVLAMPRPIIARDRTPIDKMVDYLFGDGPNNRYALICAECHSHNGMALMEEFPYLAFRCCFCSTFNPARRQRPPQPPLHAIVRERANSEWNNHNVGEDGQGNALVEEEKTRRVSESDVGSDEQSCSNALIRPGTPEQTMTGSHTSVVEDPSPMSKTR